MKRGILAGLLCMLVACGFSPIYGTHGGGPVAAELNDVEIAAIPNREGQMLRNDLIDRMYGKGRPQHPKYTLTITPKFTEESVGLLPNAVTTLAELTLAAHYVLADSKGQTLTHGDVHAMADYNQLEEGYATVAAREGAYQRTLHEVSEQIVNRVSLYFAEQAEQAPAAAASDKP